MKLSAAELIREAEYASESVVIPYGEALSVQAQQELYGPAYYESHLGEHAYGRHEAHWIRFFGRIAEHITVNLRPRCVFDAGCAHGFLLEALFDRGVQIFGRDISKYALSQVRDDIRQFVEQGDIASDIAGEFDLVTCIEVLEHMSESDSFRAIQAMSSVTNQILFSSSPSDMVEPTHINVKPTRWWLDRFAEVGFAPVEAFDASCIAAHAFLLRRSDTPIGAAALDRFSKRVGRRVQFREGKAWLRRQVGTAITVSKLFLPKRGILNSCASTLAK